MKKATDVGAPIIGLNGKWQEQGFASEVLIYVSLRLLLVECVACVDSGGARIQEGIDSLAGYADV